MNNILLVNKTLLTASLAICLLNAPTIAFAYIGPGAGLSAFGSLFALVAAFFVAILGFIWLPIKRLLKGKPEQIEELLDDNGELMERK